MQKLISVKKSEKRQLLDFTEDIEREIAKYKVAEGILVVFTKHTTCSLIISEIEDKLEKDLLNYFEQEGPRGPFSHSHGDQSHTPAHILSATIGQSLVIPVKNSQMFLGTWQRISLVEFDGPREREIVIQILQ